VPLETVIQNSLEFEFGPFGNGNVGQITFSSHPCIKFLGRYLSRVEASGQIQVGRGIAISTVFETRKLQVGDEDCDRNQAAEKRRSK
jgi:hypothetical protein